MLDKLKKRSYETEILDGFNFTTEEFAVTLKQLALVNKLTCTHRANNLVLKKIAAKTGDQVINVLDIGFGYGDGARSMEKFARKNNIKVKIKGIELNPRATELATSVPVHDINFFTGNIYDLKEEEKFHLIMNTQMMHHLNDSEIIKLLKWMTEHASVGWFINDLHRHGIAYLFFKPLAKMLGLNTIIQNDGKLSIARAFKKEEWLRYLKQAGIDPARVSIRWHWPFRYGIYYKK